MGYSHTMPQVRLLRDEEWTALTERVAWLLDRLPPHSRSAGGYYAEEPLRLAREYDTLESPEVSASAIQFNGVGEMGAETFVLERSPQPYAFEGRFPVVNVVEYLDGTVERSVWPLGYRFCKTERKPYDLAVCGVLLLVEALVGDAFVIASDGGPAEWAPALAWTRGVFGAPEAVERFGTGLLPRLALPDLVAGPPYSTSNEMRRRLRALESPGSGAEPPTPDLT